MAASKADDKKTMDVAKPGKSAPDTSARPVLVTHRPMVQDPMVKEDHNSDSPPDLSAKASASAGALAKDEDQTSGESKPEPATHGEKVIAPPSDQLAEEAAIEPEPEPPKPEKSEQETQAEEAAVVDAVADQATADKKKQNKLTDEEKAKQEAVAKLIAEKKYFVPIGQVSHRRNQRMAMVFVVLILIAAGGYLALDAEFIKTSINLPIDLIKT